MWQWLAYNAEYQGDNTWSHRHYIIELLEDDTWDVKDVRDGSLVLVEASWDRVEAYIEE